YFLSQGHEVIGVFNKREINFPSENFIPKKLDLTEREEVLGFFSDQEEAIVIHAAALANAAQCEADSDLAFLVNREGTRNVVDGIAQGSSQNKLIYISTDLVFDGCRASEIPPMGISESFTPKTNSVYAESKLAGEQI